MTDSSSFTQVWLMFRPSRGTAERMRGSGPGLLQEQLHALALIMQGKVDIDQEQLRTVLPDEYADTPMKVETRQRPRRGSPWNVARTHKGHVSTQVQQNGGLTEPDGQK